jgi:hypothetical protein
MPEHHDPNNPMSFVNAIEIIGLATKLPPCPHCYRTTKLHPMTDVGWGLELFHEPDCPEHEDNQAAAEYDASNTDPADPPGSSEDW